MENEVTQLVEKAKAGDMVAWNLLIRIFQKKITGIALVITKNIHDADDVAQNVFVQLFKNLKKIREPEKIQAWLVKTTVNKAKDYLRAKQTKRWIPFLDTEHRSANVNEDDLYLKEIKQIFDLWKEKNLSQKEQIIFQLRFGEDMQIDEIAEALDMNINTVKTHLHRAMNKIKTFSKGELDE